MSTLGRFARSPPVLRCPPLPAAARRCPPLPAAARRQHATLSGHSRTNQDSPPDRPTLQPHPPTRPPARPRTRSSPHDDHATSGIPSGASWSGGSCTAAGAYGSKNWSLAMNGRCGLWKPTARKKGRVSPAACSVSSCTSVAIARSAVLPGGGGVIRMILDESLGRRRASGHPRRVGRRERLSGCHDSSGTRRKWPMGPQRKSRAQRAKSKEHSITG